MASWIKKITLFQSVLSLFFVLIIGVGYCVYLTKNYISIEELQYEQLREKYEMEKPTYLIHPVYPIVENEMSESMKAESMRNLIYSFSALDPK